MVSVLLLWFNHFGPREHSRCWLWPGPDRSCSAPLRAPAPSRPGTDLWPSVFRRDSNEKPASLCVLKSSLRPVINPSSFWSITFIRKIKKVSCRRWFVFFHQKHTPSARSICIFSGCNNNSLGPGSGCTEPQTRWSLSAEPAGKDEQRPEKIKTSGPEPEREETLKLGHDCLIPVHVLLFSGLLVQIKKHSLRTCWVHSGREDDANQTG